MALQKILEYKGDRNEYLIELAARFNIELKKVGRGIAHNKDTELLFKCMKYQHDIYDEEGFEYLFDGETILRITIDVIDLDNLTKEEDVLIFDFNNILEVDPIHLVVKLFNGEFN